MNITEEIYLNLDDSTWAYDAFHGGYVAEFTVSPTAKNFTTSDFTIDGCTNQGSGSQGGQGEQGD